MANAHDAKSLNRGAASQCQRDNGGECGGGDKWLTGGRFAPGNEIRVRVLERKKTYYWKIKEAGSVAKQSWILFITFENNARALLMSINRAQAFTEKIYQTVCPLSWTWRWFLSPSKSFWPQNHAKPCKAVHGSHQLRNRLSLPLSEPEPALQHPTKRATLSCKKSLDTTPRPALIFQEAVEVRSLCWLMYSLITGCLLTIYNEEGLPNVKKLSTGLEYHARHGLN